MHIRTEQHPARRAGRHVDVGIDAALADEAQIRQAFEQGRFDRRALAEKDQRLGGGEPCGQRRYVVGMIGPYCHHVPVEQAEAPPFTIPSIPSA